MTDAPNSEKDMPPEKSVSGSNTLLSSLFGNWMYDPGSTELIWTAEMYEILRISSALKPSFDLLFSAIHPEDAESTRKAITEALEEKKKTVCEYRCIGEDGNIKYILSVVNILQSGNTPARFAGTLQDITQKRREEIRLKENEERYRRLAEVTFEGIIITGQGKIQEANAAMAKLCGYEVEEMIGMSAFDIVTPESAKIMYQNIVAGYEKPYVVEGFRKDGSYIPVEVCGRTIIYKGEPIRVASVRDITERKKAEDDLRKLNENLEAIVKERTYEVFLQKEIIEIKNRDITDSIMYAKKIQEALFPDPKRVSKFLPQSFIMYRPKDIVSGDFYWFSNEKDTVAIGAVDCTGHGVPGAFMSVIGHTLLHQIINELHIHSPAEILKELDKRVRIALNQHEVDSESNDGMDMALCTINTKTKVLDYAGAGRPAFIIRGGEVHVIKGDRMAIGGHHFGGKIFTSHHFKLQENDLIYLFSDGFSDQFGGPKNKKFSPRRLKELLLSCAGKSMQEQLVFIEQAFLTWKGINEQIDDVLLIGFKVFSDY